MICSRCGKEIPDDSVFCTFCGQPTGNAPKNQAQGAPQAAPQGAPYGAPYGGQKKKTGLIIGIVAVVVVAAVLLIVLLLRNVVGHVDSDEAVENTVRALVSHDEPGKFLFEKPSEERTAKVSLTCDDLSSLLSAFGSNLGFITGAFSVDYTGARGSAKSLDVKVGLFGIEYTLQFYASGDEAIVAAPGLLSQSYRIDLANFEKDFAASPFAPGCNSGMDLSQEQYDQVIQAVADYRKTMKEQASGASAEKTLKDRMKEDGLKTDFTESNEKIDVDGQNLRCRAYTLELDPADLAKYAEWILKFTDSDTYQKLQESMDLEQVNQMLEGVSGFIQGLDSAKIVYYVYKNYMVRADIYVTGSSDSDTSSLIFTFGKDPGAESGKATAAYYQQEAKEPSAQLTYTWETTDSGCSAILLANVDGEGQISVTYQRDKKDGKFTLALDTGEDSGRVGLSGVMNVQDGKLNVSSLKLSGGGEDIDLTSLSVGISWDGEVQKPSGEPKNFLQLTAEEIQALMDEIVSRIFRFANEEIVPCCTRPACCIGTGGCLSAA